MSRFLSVLIAFLSISAAAIAELYGAPVEQVHRFQIDGLNAIKISFPRSQPQGGVVERDMHSGQQYIPLLGASLLASYTPLPSKPYP